MGHLLDTPVVRDIAETGKEQGWEGWGGRKLKEDAMMALCNLMGRFFRIVKPFTG